MDHIKPRLTDAYNLAAEVMAIQTVMYTMTSICSAGHVCDPQMMPRLAGGCLPSGVSYRGYCG